MKINTPVWLNKTTDTKDVTNVYKEVFKCVCVYDLYINAAVFFYCVNPQGQISLQLSVAPPQHPQKLSQHAHNTQKTILFACLLTQLSWLHH